MCRIGAPPTPFTKTILLRLTPDLSSRLTEAHASLNASNGRGAHTCKSTLVSFLILQGLSTLPDHLARAEFEAFNAQLPFEQDEASLAYGAYETDVDVHIENATRPRKAAR